MAIHIPTAEETREVLGQPNTWPEASIVAQPSNMALGDEPRILVRRNVVELAGPDERVFHLPGYSCISLFTGIGGMDLGCEQAGMCVLAQHEMDYTACLTLLENRPQCFRHAALIQGDICQTPTTMILESAGLRVGECHLICGGPPCQGYSHSGKRDPKDPRNNLIYDFLRVIREAQPAFFIMENVPGMVSMRRGEVLREFLQTAHEGYYETVYGMLNAVEYGVPQDRCRLFVMGTRRDLWEIEGKLAGPPSPYCFGKLELQTLADYDQRPLLRPQLRLERQAITTVYGLRYFPDRAFIKPVAPMSRRDGNIQRAKNYMKLFDRLQRDEPDRVVTEAQGDEIV